MARTVVLADFLFTATAVVAQPITGMRLAWHIGYPLLEGWIVLSMSLYLITGAFWLPVVWMQMRMRDLALATLAPRLPSHLPRVVRLRLSRLRVSAGDLLVDDRQAGPWLMGAPAEVRRWPPLGAEPAWRGARGPARQ